MVRGQAQGERRALQHRPRPPIALALLPCIAATATLLISPMPTAPHIVTLARAWIGTPYHHQASAQGRRHRLRRPRARRLSRALRRGTPEAPAAYSRDWAEAQGRETLLEAARRHLDRDPEIRRPPRRRARLPLPRQLLAKHTAIMAHPTSMIHALEGAPVCEVALSSWWRRHLAAAFAFPNSLSPLAGRGSG